MRRFIAIAAVAAFAAVSANATTIRDNCGCGIGTMALGDYEATVLSQVAATFLNNLCGNQTFGITSGTLECDPATRVVRSERVREYVEGNMDHLAMDMATGQGETLHALADLMEVPAKDRDSLFTSLQANFDNIFASEAVTADEVISGIAAVL
jgi:hypothetical protein